MAAYSAQLVRLPVIARQEMWSVSAYSATRDERWLLRDSEGGGVYEGLRRSVGGESTHGEATL